MAKEGKPGKQSHESSEQEHGRAPHVAGGGLAAGSNGGGATAPQLRDIERDCGNERKFTAPDPCQATVVIHNTGKVTGENCPITVTLNDTSGNAVGQIKVPPEKNGSVSAPEVHEVIIKCEPSSQHKCKYAYSITWA